MKRYTNPALIKESIDSLPAGLLFFYPGGMVKLINSRMEDIAMLMTGAPISDAEAFSEEALSKGRYVTLSDGTSVSFARHEVRAEGNLFYELIASDVTEEVQYNQELRAQREDAARLNARLKALSESVKYMSMEKEALAVKVKIHDTLGQILLMVKRALLEPDHADVQALKQELLSNIAVLDASNEPELWNRPFFEDMARFKALGVELVTIGELPQEEALHHIIETALAVHVTNVLRHAGGTKAFVETKKTHSGSYIMEFSNDGFHPEGPVKETGGLLNLRREVEQMGGTMEIESAPEFKLRLTLPT